MKNSLLLILVLTVIVIACNKDKFTTEPIVEVKSISPGIVNNGDVITLKSRYTDDEGDLDSIYVVYKWYNGTAIVRNDTFRCPVSILNLPTNQEGVAFNVGYEIRRSNTVSLHGSTSFLQHRFAACCIAGERKWQLPYQFVCHRHFNLIHAILR